MFGNEPSCGEKSGLAGEPDLPALLCLDPAGERGVPSAHPRRHGAPPDESVGCLHIALILYSPFFTLHSSAQGVITTVAGTTWIFRGDGGPALNAPLGDLGSVAVDSEGNVFVADFRNHIVGKISTNGVLHVVAGSGIGTFSSGDGGSGTAASLSGPWGVGIDSSGNVYIAERGHRVRKVTREGIIITIAGTGNSGFSGDGGPATNASLTIPLAVAPDATGNLYIADTGNHRVRKVGPDGVITTIAGNGVAGFSGDGGAATAASLSSPHGLTVDSRGNLYISDSGNGRIRKVTPGGLITTLAGGGTNFPGDGGPAFSGQLAFPWGLALERDGSLYIADSGNTRIRKVTPAGIISTVAGGNVGFSGDGGLATAASLNSPSGVAVDSAGNLYISDLFNRRVRKVDPAGHSYNCRKRLV